MARVTFVNKAQKAQGDAGETQCNCDSFEAQDDQLEDAWSQASDALGELQL